MLHLILSSLYVLESKSFKTPTPHKVCKLFKFLEVLQILSNDTKQFTCCIYVLTDQLAEKSPPWIKHFLVAEPTLSTPLIQMPIQQIWFQVSSSSSHPHNAFPVDPSYCHPPSSSPHSPKRLFLYFSYILG
jgi:hypothetical protein